MSKEKKSDFNANDFNANWYDVWMKQSRQFFESANVNLKDLFASNAFANPEDYRSQIDKWLEMLKSQWQFIELNEQQKSYQNYMKAMMDMCNEASDMMVNEWMKRSKENNPVKNVRELYELWLNCCQKVYAKSMHSKSYQDVYGEFMNATLDYWKSVMPK